MPAVGFHFPIKSISRGKGQSVVAAVAYRTGEKQHDERLDKIFDYRARSGVELVHHAVPKDAPEWAQDIGRAWNAVERAEVKKNASVAHEYVGAFPHELTEQQRAWMLKDFVREQLTRKGFMATAVIHKPGKDGDQRNYHCHILFSARPLGAAGFAANKDRRFSSYEERGKTHDAMREKWAELCARQLERAGLTVEAERWRHGHKTLAVQRALALERGDLAYAAECDREPTQHLGPVATEIERDGRPSHRGDENRAIEADHAERQRLKQDIARLEQMETALERHQQQLDAHPVVQAINRAWERSDNPVSFAAALREAGVVIAHVSEQDAERRELARQAQAERPPPELTAGDLYAIDRDGKSCRLDATTLKADEPEIAARLAGFTPDTTPSIGEAWRKERRGQEAAAQREAPSREPAAPPAPDPDAKPMALRRLEAYGERLAARNANPARDYSALRDPQPAPARQPTPDADREAQAERNRALVREMLERKRDRERERER